MSGNVNSVAFLPCGVIPIYNHGTTITAVTTALMSHDLPVFVVDDGSDEPTRQVLADLAATYPARIHLLRLEVNSGKGAAVMTGLRAAYTAGYTHALQIDADGQHNTDDVPRFLAAARADPAAVVLGQPIYDSNVPKSRLYGRYATHIWVWIETLSLEIRDSMCGFRIYPLATVQALMDKVKLSKRMEFDIEILVRLHWLSTVFKTLPTAVTYTAGGISHFDVLWDNVRISQAHTRLATGMVLRLPLLLARKLMHRRRDAGDGSQDGSSAQGSSTAARPPAWWRMTERGSRFGMQLLAFSCRLFGLSFTRLWLHPVVAYFLLTGSTARRASHRYFERLRETVQDENVPTPGWRTAYKHTLAFADSALDKLAAWSGIVGAQDVDFPDQTMFDALVASGQGALIIGAHIGNLEMMRALAVRGGHARITAIVYIEHAKHFNSVLADAHDEFAMRLVAVRDVGPATAMMMKERIENGELLVIVGDRVPAHERGRTVAARFLGRSAPFAQGPFVLAHALACPVYLFFCPKIHGRYRLYFEAFAERVRLPRATREQELSRYAQAYAHRLEHYCQLAPFQWFNFFDFWGNPKDAGDGRK